MALRSRELWANKASLGVGVDDEWAEWFPPETVAVLQAQAAAININAGAGWVPAADDLPAAQKRALRTRVFFEYKFLGVNPHPGRIRTLLRQLIIFGISDMEDLGRHYGSLTDLQTIGVPNQEITTILRLKEVVSEFKNNEKVIETRAKKKQPITKIDLATRLVETGCNRLPQAVQPDAEMVRVFLVKKEEGRSSFPFLEIKTEPWLDATWKIGNGDMGDTIKTDAMLDIVQSFEGGESAPETAAQKVALQATAKLKKLNLGFHVHSAALQRLLLTAGMCGVFRPHFVALVVVGYAGVLGHIALHHGVSLAKEYDVRLRTKLGRAGLMTAEVLENSFMRRDQEILDDLANEKRFETKPTNPIQKTPGGGGGPAGGPPLKKPKSGAPKGGRGGKGLLYADLWQPGYNSLAGYAPYPGPPPPPASAHPAPNNGGGPQGFPPGQKGQPSHSKPVGKPPAPAPKAGPGQPQ
ncbi:unnamed protein product [Amoebophrya sp. A25]|nr:unnamed protein product [Amoebophrya sp. A25]|eukprot:GSA25T00023374001.1